MSVDMKNVLMKTGAVLVLILGIILFVGFVGAGVYCLILYSDGNAGKKVTVASIFFIAGIVEFIISIASFEGLFEIVHLKKYEEKLDRGAKWTDQ